MNAISSIYSYFFPNTIKPINHSEEVTNLTKCENFDNIPKYIIFWICMYLSEDDLIALSQYNDRYKTIVDEFPSWKESYSHVLMSKN